MIDAALVFAVTMRGMIDAMEKDTVETMEAKSNALANTARVWDDGIIDPADTRSVVAFALSICREADERTVNSNKSITFVVDLCKVVTQHTSVTSSLKCYPYR